MNSTKLVTIWSYKCPRMQFFGTLTTRKCENDQQGECQSACIGHTSFSIATAPAYIRLNVETEKTSIVSLSEAKDHSWVASHSCILKAIETITIRYPHFDLFGPLSIHLWSDFCGTQLRFRFVFQLTTLFPSRINVIRYYNECHHGKGSMDGIGGCIKGAIYRAVMAEKLLYTHH